MINNESREQVSLLAHDLEYSGPLELTQYFIKKKVFSNQIDNKGAEILHVDIYLGRRLLSIILTIFAPTVILNIVGHSSNYFKEFFFEAVISLNVTVMLVLTTMFISISNNLPKTSYMKMVDVWLLFNLFYPFIVVLLHTYMDTLRSDDDLATVAERSGILARRLERLRRMSLVQIPGFCLMFAIIYWIIGLKHAEAI